MANVALLATVADSKASQAAGAVSALMPSGIVLPYAGSTTPAGWLVCDGTAYNQADYPELFAALGSTYNTQVNPTTGSAWAAPSAGQFRVPDMRGMFLRGEGTPSGLDAVTVGGNQVDKTKKNALSATSSTPTVSGTTNIAHNHGASSLSIDNTNLSHGHEVIVEGLASFRQSFNSNVYYGFGYTSGGDAIRSDWLRRVMGDSQLGNHVHGGTAAGQSLGATNPSLSGTVSTPTITIGGGDNETRPINRGVRYIIKV